MAYFALLWKARTIERYRLKYEQEKLNSILLANAEVPKLSLSQKLRHFRYDARKKLNRKVRRTCPALVDFIISLKTDQTFPNFVVKSVIGFVGGIILTYLCFMFFVFQLAISLVHATIMSCIIGVLLTLGLAFSYRVRCLVFLLIPQFFSRVGRYTLTCYAFVLILTGPATNTLRNSEVLSESMACGQEQVKASVRQITDSIKKPFNSLKDTIKVMTERVKEVAVKFKDVLLKFQRLIMSIVRVLQSAFSWLTSIVGMCNKKVGTPYVRCTRALREGVLDCQAKLGPYFSWLCNVVHVAQFACVAVKPLDFICYLVEFVSGSVIDNIKMKLRQFSNHIKTMLYVSVHVHHSYYFNSNSSKSASQVAAGIVTEIRHRAEPLLTWLSWSSCVTSLFLLLIIFRAKHYQYMYDTRSRFDNRYVTKEMRALDLKRVRENRDTVLPLNRRERAKYINTTSFRLLASEKMYLTRSLIFMCMTTFKLLIHIVADYSLYWVLMTIRYHGRFQSPQLPGVPDAGVQVSGEGPVAGMMRSLVDSLTVPLATPIPSPASCLPNPYPPDIQRYTQIGILIFLLWFFALFEPYGLRLRHVIMGHYRPERAKARAIWLYNHILRTRGGFLKLARRKLHRNYKYSSEQKFTFRQWLDSNIPFWWLRKLLRTAPSEPHCLLCGTTENPTDPDTKLIKCETPNCPGIFCMSCFSDIGNLCTICLSPVDYGDISDVSLEKGSSEEGSSGSETTDTESSSDRTSVSPDTARELKAHSLSDSGERASNTDTSDSSKTSLTTNKQKRVVKPKKKSKKETKVKPIKSTKQVYYHFFSNKFDYKRFKDSRKLDIIDFETLECGPCFQSQAPKTKSQSTKSTNTDSEWDKNSESHECTCDDCIVKNLPADKIELTMHEAKDKRIKIMRGFKSTSKKNSFPEIPRLELDFELDKNKNNKSKKKPNKKGKNVFDDKIKLTMNETKDERTKSTPEVIKKTSIKNSFAESPELKVDKKKTINKENSKERHFEQGKNVDERTKQLHEIKKTTSKKDSFAESPRLEPNKNKSINKEDLEVRNSKQGEKTTTDKNGQSKNGKNKAQRKDIEITTNTFTKFRRNQIRRGKRDDNRNKNSNNDGREINNKNSAVNTNNGTNGATTNGKKRKRRKNNFFQYICKKRIISTLCSKVASYRLRYKQYKIKKKTIRGMPPVPLILEESENELQTDDDWIKYQYAKEIGETKKTNDEMLPKTVDDLEFMALKRRAFENIAWKGMAEDTSAVRNITWPSTFKFVRCHCEETPCTCTGTYKQSPKNRIPKVHNKYKGTMSYIKSYVKPIKPAKPAETFLKQFDKRTIEEIKKEIIKSRRLGPDDCISRCPRFSKYITAEERKLNVMENKIKHVVKKRLKEEKRFKKGFHHKDESVDVNHKPNSQEKDRSPDDDKNREIKKDMKLDRVHSHISDSSAKEIMLKRKSDTHTTDTKPKEIKQKSKSDNNLKHTSDQNAEETKNNFKLEKLSVHRVSDAAKNTKPNELDRRLSDGKRKDNIDVKKSKVKWSSDDKFRNVKQQTKLHRGNKHTYDDKVNIQENNLKKVERQTSSFKPKILKIDKANKQSSRDKPIEINKEKHNNKIGKWASGDTAKNTKNEQIKSSNSNKQISFDKLIEMKEKEKSNKSGQWTSGDKYKDIKQKIQFYKNDKHTTNVDKTKNTAQETKLNKGNKEINKPLKIKKEGKFYNIGNKADKNVSGNKPFELKNRSKTNIGKKTGDKFKEVKLNSDDDKTKILKQEKKSNNQSDSNNSMEIKDETKYSKIRKWTSGDKYREIRQKIKINRDDQSTSDGEVKKIKQNMSSDKINKHTSSKPTNIKLDKVEKQHSTDKSKAIIKEKKLKNTGKWPYSNKYNEIKQKIKLHRDYQSTSDDENQKMKQKISLDKIDKQNSGVKLSDVKLDNVKKQDSTDKPKAIIEEKKLKNTGKWPYNNKYNEIKQKIKLHRDYQSTSDDEVQKMKQKISLDKIDKQNSGFKPSDVKLDNVKKQDNTDKPKAIIEEKKIINIEKWPYINKYKEIKQKIKSYKFGNHYKFGDRTKRIKQEKKLVDKQIGTDKDLELGKFESTDSHGMMSSLNKYKSSTESLVRGSQTVHSGQSASAKSKSIRDEASFQDLMESKPLSDGVSQTTSTQTNISPADTENFTESSDSEFSILKCVDEPVKTISHCCLCRLVQRFLSIYKWIFYPGGSVKCSCGSRGNAEIIPLMRDYKKSEDKLRLDSHSKSQSKSLHGIPIISDVESPREDLKLNFCGPTCSKQKSSMKTIESKLKDFNQGNENQVKIEPKEVKIEYVSEKRSQPNRRVYDKSYSSHHYRSSDWTTMS